MRNILILDEEKYKTFGFDAAVSMMRFLDFFAIRLLNGNYRIEKCRWFEHDNSEISPSLLQFIINHARTI